MRVTRVDGNNNVVVELDRDAFRTMAVLPELTAPIVSPGESPDTVRVKIGAAGSRYLGSKLGIGPNPRRWPSTLPAEAEVMLIQAIPHAWRVSP